ncbi:MAG: 23S rRNA (uracil(1939)-C(5))-methyltransferase RlmD [Clostridiales bacterium]|jgi:23S rRNA (uracil1939-C5)-methyltransferase|nr:23S rRNA (uracil(1939)-C(5))-methyltransferase RlmD [Clostridiales bacterium]
MIEIKPGMAIELSITGFNHLGHGLGRHLGLVVFVPGTLPGELAEVRLNKIYANHAQGELLRLLKTSQERTAPFCSLFGHCGGCHLQHLNYPAQLAFKQQLLEDNLRRLGRLDLEVLPIIPSQMPFFYRNRARLHYHKGDLGFYAAASHQIIPAKSCPLLLPALNDLLDNIWRILPTHHQQLAPLRSITLKANHDSSQLALILTSDLPLGNLDSLSCQLSQADQALASIWLNWGRARGGNHGPKWRLIFGQPAIEEKLGSIRLAVSPASFLQTNWPQAKKLYNLALDALELKEEESLIDLYCGIGSIALLAAGRVAQVAGVEEYAPAVEDAKRNAVSNQITNVHFYAGKVEGILPRLQAADQRPQALVLNPPRSGSSRKALAAIGVLQAHKVVYISCNPAALARDLRLLTEAGYQAEWARPVDMFPQVAHVETVVSLRCQSHKISPRINQK